MAALYDRLAKVGLPRDYVEDVILPPWWRNELGHDRSGFLHAAGLIASHAQLATRSLLDANAPVAFRPFHAALFKKNKSVTEHDVQASQRIAASIARLACSVFHRDYTPLPPSAADIRRELLAESKTGQIDFQTIFAYLWRRGMPVLFIAKLPAKGKFDGMIVRCGERPVILMAKKHKQNACLAALLGFIIGHEIGHLVSGHLDHLDAIVDEDLHEEGKADPKEDEANAVSRAVLFGSSQRVYHLFARFPAPLLKAAREAAEKDHVDTGMVILNNAHRQNSADAWRMAFAAVKNLQSADVIKQIFGKMREELCLTELRDDDREFFQRVTWGQEGADTLSSG